MAATSSTGCTTWSVRGSLADVVADALARPIDPGLLFLPYLNGERSPLWRDDLRGAIVGLGAHHGRLDVVRAAVDGVAAAVIELAAAVSSCVPAPAEVRLTGGFLQESAWVQLVTDALGVPTAVPDPKEATATGAAVLGWLGLGRPAPVPPLPSRPTEGRAPDMAAHGALAEKAFFLGETRSAPVPRGGPAVRLSLAAWAASMPAGMPARMLGVLSPGPVRSWQGEP